MKTGKKLLTGTLLALCAALLVLCIVLAAGWSKAAKTDTALPEVRNNGTAIQWKYSDEADWHDLVALTELRGAAGEEGHKIPAHVQTVLLPVLHMPDQAGYSHNGR